MDEAARHPGAALRVLQGLAATVVLLAGLRLGAPILVPIAFALFLTILSLPFFRWLLRRGLPSMVASLVTVILIVAGLALFTVLALGSLGELRETGPLYYRTLQERFTYTSEWWSARGIVLENWIPVRWRDPQVIAGVVGGTLRGALAVLSEITIVLLLLVFLLGEAAAFPGRLARLPRAVQETLRHFGTVSSELQRYLIIKTLMSSAVGVVAGGWLAFLGVDFAVLWGIVAFGCHFIPNIGAVLAVGPPMLVALVQFDASQALAVAVGYFVIGLLLGNLIEPTLLGRQLGLSTLVVFLSLVVWGWLWGAVGMFLSVPLTMSLRILLAHSKEWGWVAALIDSPPRALPPAAAAVAAGEPAVEESRR
ncbi:MAG TPA: AI-2E family transporter [Thermoanaerobaculia bacterium]|nr:AI-2E family transporter [Thermoanaerobaculia bacterium]